MARDWGIEGELSIGAGYCRHNVMESLGAHWRRSLDERKALELHMPGRTMTSSLPIDLFEKSVRQGICFGLSR